MCRFLVYEEVEGEKVPRCTACGICSKVCPTQCIWITRAEDPETGKPLKTPAEFAIDIDLCMNCGYLRGILSFRCHQDGP